MLFTLLKEAARENIPVLITSDHGSIHCHTPATVFAKRDATANLRYKFGEDLRAERPEYALLVRATRTICELPRRGSGANTLLAVGDTFFVYPTKLREYQTRYRGSFLHGGVTPEEVHPAGGAAHAAPLVDRPLVQTNHPVPASARVAHGGKHCLQSHRRRARRLFVRAADPVPRTRCSVCPRCRSRAAG